MEKLYEYILEGLKNSPDFYNPNLHQTFESYLASLQESAKYLWKSYRSTPVEVRYSDPQVQAAYLIRYYPHYVQMTLEILRLSPEIFTFPEQINACFFGAGPCPEVAGLAQFLTEHCPETKSMIVKIYDIASEQWKFSRDITKNFIVPRLWKGDISGTVSKFDLCSVNAFEVIADDISNCHIFIFQNCLNEIWNTSATQENIKFLLNRAPLNSFIIIGDLPYEQNRQLIEDIAEIANQRSDYQIILQSQGIKIRSCIRIPSLVTENLLTGVDGLIPRKNINFLFLALRKGEYTNEDLLDDIF
ncbi:hypothetical protein [Aphanizomenon flos-aquae]|jgi:hypothetical protein|uniref:Histidine-specific methyltransferase SAM-dependent domain-containing protein n=1 Tax=Aphanizomenon flos-aquae FACHB-1040 TaxID=2692887 RepID=A0ABR8C147_APHFL|nr:hypothetical protein [Aphanizomenon flos-aquae]MBD2280587.1 hypothetical protein [Aphanizomenon flos-aquae FACHB-1040]